MDEFCLRLRETRRRLGLNQADFGALAGVTRNTQFKYENGDRDPDSGYLNRLQQQGVDLYYLFTGRMNADSLSVVESEVVEAMRLMRSEDVPVVHRVAQALVSPDANANTSMAVPIVVRRASVRSLSQDPSPHSDKP